MLISGYTLFKRWRFDNGCRDVQDISHQWQSFDAVMKQRWYDSVLAHNSKVRDILHEEDEKRLREQESQS